MMLLLLLLLIQRVLLFCPFCVALDGERELFDALFADYSKEIRPLHDAKQTLVIDLELEISQLKKLDENAEVLYSSARIGAAWTDEHLTWEPDEYDGIVELLVSPKKVWLPDIGIENSAGQFYDESYFELYRVHVSHTGRMKWWFGGVMETSCHIDGELFPFDSQSCKFVVQSWAYSEAYVDLRNATNSVELERFNDDDIWDLIGSSTRRSRITEDGAHYAVVEFTIYLDRKPLFYVVNIITPVMFLVLVVLMVYWLPPDCGDKTSLSITVLLAFSVMLFVVTDTIPPSSEKTPVLGVFVTVTMAVSTVSVMESIIVMRLCSIQSTRMPSVVRFVAFRLVGRALCVTRSPTSSTKHHRDRGEKNDCQENPDLQESLLGDTAMSDVAKNRSELLDKINDVLVELRKITAKQEKSDAEAETNEEWRDLGNVLDRLMFFVSLIVLSWVTVWMVIKSAELPDMPGVPAVRQSGQHH